MVNKGYKLEDISVIIATYNRDEDLSKTLESFKKDIAGLGEVLIIDQSTNNKTKNLINKNKKIKYIHSKTPSLTLARNFGIKKSSNKSKILLFLDDDVTLKKDYFIELINVFNTHTDALAVGGYFFSKKEGLNKFANIARRFFFIEHNLNNDSSVLSAYGACYPSKLTKIIKAGWLPGFNMAFKKELLKKEVFDENFFRYGLGEDFEFTTRILKKYPGSIYITPDAKLIHRVSIIERMPKPKLAYMNQINHLYIQSKNFNNFKGILSSAIALFMISLTHTLSFILKPNKFKKAKFILHFKALKYCFNRLHLIRKGKLELPFDK